MLGIPLIGSVHTVLAAEQWICGGTFAKGVKSAGNRHMGPLWGWASAFSPTFWARLLM